MEKKGNAGWAVLVFFLPLIGLILYLVWRDSHPEDSKMAGKGALIGFIIGIVLVVIYFILMATVIGSLMSGIGDAVYTMKICF